MSAFPPEQIRAMRAAAKEAARPLASLVERWEDLHRQGNELGKLADLAVEPFTGQLAAFAKQLERAGQSQVELAWQAVEDIDAMMQPGLTALRTITARGQDATAPALALWREFYSARQAILQVVGAADPNAQRDAA